jgi:hypothetical protein
MRPLVIGFPKGCDLIVMASHGRHGISAIVLGSETVMLGTTVSGNRVAAAQTKVTQKAVGYQDTPKGTHRCDNCAQFESHSSCKVVEGNIEPAGWCKVYGKKPAYC